MHHRLRRPLHHLLTAALLPLTASQTLSGTPALPDLYTNATQLPQRFDFPVLAQQPNPPSQQPNLFNDLAPRQQGACAPSFTACAASSLPSVCCGPGTGCTTDGGANMACCASGAFCTGTLGIDVRTLSPSATTTSPSPSIPLSPTGTVPNAPFPFAYIPHSFGDAAQCRSYYTSCGDTYASCTRALAGGTGLTITGVGVTLVTGQAAAPSQSAVSVCASLSTAACYGLQTSICAQYGTPAAGAGGRRGVVAEWVEVGIGVLVGVVGGL